MTEFKVGDKVRHSMYGEAEIVLGPVDFSMVRGGYVVKHEHGTHRVSTASALSAVPEPPKFAIGDTVTYTYGTGGKIVAGPFQSEYHDDPIWVVEKPNGTHMTPTETSLRKVAPGIKVGDRARIMAATYAEETRGKVGTVEEVDSRERFDGIDHPYLVRLAPHFPIYASEVELVEDANTYTHDGVTYDLTASYRDQGGCVWSFTGKRIGGVPTVTCSGRTDNPDTIASIADDFGPLTRV